MQSLQWTEPSNRGRLINVNFLMKISGRCDQRLYILVRFCLIQTTTFVLGWTSAQSKNKIRIKNNFKKILSV